MSITNAQRNVTNSLSETLEGVDEFNYLVQQQKTNKHHQRSIKS